MSDLRNDFNVPYLFKVLRVVLPSGCPGHPMVALKTNTEDPSKQMIVPTVKFLAKPQQGVPTQCSLHQS